MKMSENFMIHCSPSEIRVIWGRLIFSDEVERVERFLDWPACTGLLKKPLTTRGIYTSILSRAKCDLGGVKSRKPVR